MSIPRLKAFSHPHALQPPLSDAASIAGLLGLLAVVWLLGVVWFVWLLWVVGFVWLLWVVRFMWAIWVWARALLLFLVLLLLLVLFLLLFGLLLLFLRLLLSFFRRFSWWIRKREQLGDDRESGEYGTYPWAISWSLPRPMLRNPYCSL